MKDEFFQIDEKTWISPKFSDITKNIVYTGKYFFITRQILPKRKTPIYYIFEFNGVCIGEIRWYASWRKFCFYPYDDTIWDTKCLNSVIEYIDNINEEYKINKGEVDNDKR